MTHDTYSLVKQEKEKQKNKNNKENASKRMYVKQSGDSSYKRECGWGSRNNKVSSCLEEEDFTLLLEKATVG